MRTDVPLNQREALRNIRTFPQLIKFLRDELEWPIESQDFEELTFDYTPEELGIDARSAAKIQEIKRLRPLSARQPWGIFFVKFEPKRLPVVALRRVLGRVVLKKRASANSAERMAWKADDLLFISNYGENTQRQISFAHFSQEVDRESLPTLKVLGWDNRDTSLHLDDIAETLHKKLAWPEDDRNTTGWRELWRSAFTLRNHEVVKTSKELAVRLADLARSIRARIERVLEVETPKGPVTQLMEAFKEALIHDLSADDFADMYAQTISYGLLSARIANPARGREDALLKHIPVTNPFLKELMEAFLGNRGSQRKNKGGGDIDFDELGVGDVVDLLNQANMEAVVRDFGDRNRDEDPVIYFYELFLKEYDAKKRVQRGVFYTPRAVVSYIVRGVHELLQKSFGLDDGLASTITWGEMVKKHKGLEVPLGAAATDPFVVILDPATGTATFLVEVIEIIHETLVARWKREGLTEAEQRDAWNKYVPRHLLTRLHGYELMMAPYAIAHLKVGLKLYETGYSFGSAERARIFLTNSLEPAREYTDRFGFAIPALAHEASAVNVIKRDQRFTVVIGNPPYSKLSANLSEDVRATVDAYRYIAGERIIERGALQFEMNLQDDYVKFARLAELAVSKATVGVVGFITNNGYLSNPTLRGMRWSLQKTFSQLCFLDLQGPETQVAVEFVKDENVFDIKQRVAISVLLRSALQQETPRVFYGSLSGRREEKYEALAGGSLPDATFKPVLSEGPFYRFVPSDRRLSAEFNSMVTLPDLFPRNSAGFITSRDALVIGTRRDALKDQISAFAVDRRAAEQVYKSYGFQPSKRLDLRAAQSAVRKDGDLEGAIRPCLYRPFDRRWVYYRRDLIESFKPIADDMQDPSNVALLATRQVTGSHVEHVFASRVMIEIKACSHDRNTQIFPLFIHQAASDGGFQFEAPTRMPNLEPAMVDRLAKATGLQWRHGRDNNARDSFCAIDVFNYVYAILHSETYRTRYFAFLRSEFPRCPLDVGPNLFKTLAGLGRELVELHLLETPKVKQFITTYKGPRRPLVRRVNWGNDWVWLDAKTKDTVGTIGFHGVAEDVWRFKIGGYQVCEKWLKDRKGCELSAGDVARYQEVVVALAGTIRLMREIDDVILANGGWPAAFFGSS